MTKLGLAISEKKLMKPDTKVVCLGVEVDTVSGTVSIPKEKLNQVKAIITEWDQKQFVLKGNYSHCSDYCYISINV